MSADQENRLSLAVAVYLLFCCPARGVHPVVSIKIGKYRPFCLFMGKLCTRHSSGVVSLDFHAHATTDQQNGDEHDAHAALEIQPAFKKAKRNDGDALVIIAIRTGSHDVRSCSFVFDAARLVE